MGNSDNSAPPIGVMSLETAACLWNDYMSVITKGTPITDFQAPERRRPGDDRRPLRDAPRARTPRRPSTSGSSTGTVPKQRDNTKVGIAVDSATDKLWQEGCEGPKVTKGFLDLSKVESKYPQWKKYNERLDRPGGARRRDRRRPGGHDDDLLLRARLVGAVRPGVGRAIPADREMPAVHAASRRRLRASGRRHRTLRHRRPPAP